MSKWTKFKPVKPYTTIGIRKTIYSQIEVLYNPFNYFHYCTGYMVSFVITDKELHDYFIKS